MIRSFTTFMTTEKLGKHFPTAFFEALTDLDSLAIPDRMGIKEPLPEVGDSKPVAENFTWDSSVFWKKKKGKVVGSFSKYSDFFHAIINHQYSSKDREVDKRIHFLKTVSLAGKVDFACMHFELMKTRPTSPLCDVTTPMLKRGLPGLPWALCLGKVYIDMIGTEKLLSLPVFKAELVTDDMVFLQLTEIWPVNEEEQAQFQTLEQELITEIGKEYFSQRISGTPSVSLPTFNLKSRG